MRICGVRLAGIRRTTEIGFSTDTAEMTSRLIRPPKLPPGGTIAFVAPSSGLAAFTPHRLQRATEELTTRGYRVKVYPSVTRTPKENVEVLVQEREAQGAPLDRALYGAEYECYGSADAITRASELMAAFLDPGVDAIVCTIGGFTSHEMLEYLDFDAIRAHPKCFVGFSDVTSLHLALQARAGMVSFYGPSAICQLGEFPGPLEYTMTHFFKALASPIAIGNVPASLEWTDDKTANWLMKTDMTYCEEMKPNAGYEWLRSGQVRGVILGGCLPVLLNVRGTPFMPDFQDAILLLETPEGHLFDVGMPLAEVNAVLGALRVDGTFTRIQGLVIGRAFKYSDEDVLELQRLVTYHTRGTNFPILYGVDIGHTNPIITLPLGCHVLLDSVANVFEIHEPGVQ